MQICGPTTDLHHQLHPVDVVIELGSCTSRAVQPDRVHRCECAHCGRAVPRVEAVHYHEHAIRLGVPAEAISVEARATNQPHLTYSRAVLAGGGITPASVLLICRPYQERRRAYATCRKVWSEGDVLCGSRPLPLGEYVESIGDVDSMINMPVRDSANCRRRRMRPRCRAGCALVEAGLAALGRSDTEIQAPGWRRPRPSARS